MRYTSLSVLTLYYQYTLVVTEVVEIYSTSGSNLNLATNWLCHPEDPYLSSGFLFPTITEEVKLGIYLLINLKTTG